MEYCALQVRTFDPDRYLTAIAAPKKFRAPLLVLYAFNLEISKTRETVSEPMLGRIRLQWWREALDGIYQGTPRNHEVVLALSFIVKEYSLSRPHFDDMINGREFDLEDREPKDIAELLSYAQSTSGSLLQLVTEITGSDEETANRIGTAWALIGLLKSIEFYRAQQRCYLPGIAVTQIGTDRALRAFGEVLNLASEHLDPNLQTSSNDLALYQWIARYDLKRLTRIKASPFTGHPTNAAWRRCRIIIASLLKS
ncbi:MAG: hypothetical protein GKS01_16930 [Alphaproteobacteria bacterium]|nr:hypothetical protein [Alphaproteobacteria bacterium]